MSLIPHEPFRYLESFRRDIDRFIGDFPRLFPDLRIDVYETDKEIIASCEIPGLKSKDNIDIEIQDHTLNLKGNLDHRQEFREEQIYRRERYTGNFQRTITLPAEVVAEESKAVYRNGVLEISMPKAGSQVQRQKIDIDFH